MAFLITCLEIFFFFAIYVIFNRSLTFMIYICHKCFKVSIMIVCIIDGFFWYYAARILASCYALLVVNPLLKTLAILHDQSFPLIIFNELGKGIGLSFDLFCGHCIVLSNSWCNKSLFFQCVFFIFSFKPLLVSFSLIKCAWRLVIFLYLLTKGVIFVSRSPLAFTSY